MLSLDGGERSKVRWKGLGHMEPVCEDHAVLCGRERTRLDVDLP